MTSGPRAGLGPVNLHLTLMSTRHRTIAIVVALVGMLAGCRESVGPASDDISVAATPAGLEIVNTTSEPIYSMEMDAGTLALIYFQFCNPHCPLQQPGERRVVPWSSILGYSEDRHDYLVMWAHGTEAADGTVELGPVRSQHVTR